MKKSKRGGKRENAGRPKGEPTTTVRLPVTVVEALKKGQPVIFPMSRNLVISTGSKKSVVNV